MRTAIPLLAMLALSACGEPERIVTALPIPPERMDCVYVATRPSIPPEQTASHEAYVQSVRAREGIIARYILDLEGRYWACASDAQWLREWQKETAN